MKESITLKKAASNLKRGRTQPLDPECHSVYTRLPMQELKDIVGRMNAQKKERQKLQGTYRDMLTNSKSYQDALEALAVAKTKKQAVEATIRAGFQQEQSELEKLKASLDADRQLMADTALTLLMKGEPIELTDENDTKYEPVFSVRFKKAG